MSSDFDKECMMAARPLGGLGGIRYVSKEDLQKAVTPRGSDLFPKTDAGVRAFGTGATRDLDANKLDFEGFLSPLVLERYAEHMHKASRMPDGSMRESDNWQLGIPQGVYIKSLWRHFFAVWKLWRGLPVTEEVRGETVVKDLETELCAVLFNTSGMLHEVLKAKRQPRRESSRSSPFEP